ncbi:cytochrome-c peroxidase, partial [bacterium]|nr:cytochrome-c peroxidase [bacterium]
MIPSRTITPVLTRARVLARLARVGSLALLPLLVHGCGSPETPLSPVDLDVDGFPPLPVPADNPGTDAGIELGRRLFHDPILSGDGTQSCASCHSQRSAFADARRFSVGIDGAAGTRNAPSLVNVAWSPTLFWDGRAASLEDQARVPVPDRLEMHLPWDAAIARLNAHPDYPGRFARAFGTATATEDRVVKALAQFERTLVSHDSHYDRFLRGQAALTASEHRGMELFFGETALCFHCHGGILMTDFAFHDIGLDEAPPDPGRELATGSAADRGRFRTPTLRNVEYSAPYMHD